MNEMLCYGVGFLGFSLVGSLGVSGFVLMFWVFLKKKYLHFCCSRVQHGLAATHVSETEVGTHSLLLLLVRRSALLHRSNFTVAVLT